MSATNTLQRNQIGDPTRMIDATEQLRRLVDEVYQTESRRVFATLIRLLGDFDLAEDALHDAFTAALKQWTKDGVPANPRA
jgi:RNA polymerase sigma-70 factor, ECF subfamily